MHILKDAYTGSEMFCDDSDKKISEVPGTDGSLMKVSMKRKTEKMGIDDSKIGANASEECQAEGSDDKTVHGLNIIMDSNLQEAGHYEKATYKIYFKKYCKTVLQKLEAEGLDEQAKVFKASAPAGFAYILKNLKEFDFYIGDSGDPEGGMGYLGYEEDGESAFMLFFKHALIREKV